MHSITTSPPSSSWFSHGLPIIPTRRHSVIVSGGGLASIRRFRGRFRILSNLLGLPLVGLHVGTVNLGNSGDAIPISPKGSSQLSIVSPEVGEVHSKDRGGCFKNDCNPSPHPSPTRGEGASKSLMPVFWRFLRRGSLSRSGHESLYHGGGAFKRGNRSPESGKRNEGNGHGEILRRFAPQDDILRRENRGVPAGRRAIFFGERQANNALAGPGAPGLRASGAGGLLWINGNTARPVRLRCAPLRVTRRGRFGDGRCGVQGRVQLLGAGRQPRPLVRPEW